MSLPKRQYTVEEYLEMERHSEEKHEFFRGDIFAMSGVDRRHDRIAGNVLARLHLQFIGRACVVHTSDMRVKVSSTGLYTYPDVSALCGAERYEDSHVDTLLNPNLVVEVLSKSTEAYDRGGKFDNYRGVDSITDYVLVSQHRPLVEHYVRQPDGRWLLTVLSGLDKVLELPSLGARLRLAEIYDKVELTDP